MRLDGQKEQLHLFDVRQALSPTLSLSMVLTLTLTWSLVAVVVSVPGLICWPFPASGLGQSWVTYISLGPCGTVAFQGAREQS